MTLFALDTDVLSLLIQGNEAVRAHVQALTGNRFSVTIVTVEETLTGWYSQIRQAKNDARLVRTYAELQRSVEFFRQIQILPFGDAAATIYRQLRTEHRRRGKNDLRIAAIALACGAVVISRNQRDFRDIVGLAVSDWSVAATELPKQHGPPADD
jgi:tRNA(fMet)-specific endonuclease VapC